MATTTIKLQDGVSDGGRHLTEITLRDIGFLDVVAMASLNLGEMPDALKVVARLSGAPFDLLQWLTQDDVITVLTGLDQHMSEFNDKAGL